MKNFCGQFFISAPTLDDPNFLRSVIFIIAHDEDGAMGYVMNKRHGRAFNELTEFKHAKPLLLYNGGPVETDQLFFIHRRADIIPSGDLVAGDVYAGGDFKKAVELLNNGALTEKDIRLFIGYCGWDAGELEAEIEEGSWLKVDADPFKEMPWEGFI